MTVTELLACIMAVYAGATPEALKTFVPVFHKRFRAREGDHLQVAADEVFATFKAKYGQPFPIPADFEPHMPKLHHAGRGDGGSPIRAAMEARNARATRLHAAWLAEQGHKIKAARHISVYGACVLMIMDICRVAHDRTQRVMLTADQIAECEMRALSSERAHRWQPAKTNEEWDEQIEQIRAEWAKPVQQEAA